MPDPVERELARIRAEQEHEARMEELARLGQEMGLYDHPERLQEDSDHQLDALRYIDPERMQDDDLSDFRALATMWLVVFLAAAVGFAVWLAS